MPPVSVVVDTSVWIDFFAGRQTPALLEGLATGAVVLPPIVVAELVSGARTEAMRATLVDLVSDLPLHPSPLAHWLAVGDLRRRLQQNGIMISTPDAHVAQCALDLDGLLLSRDAIFEQVARLLPLRLAGA
jgi:predicted nucleic acid-binding protein